MNLAAVDHKDWNRWGQHPTSILGHHQAGCCRNARNWFLSMARSFDFRLTEQQQMGGTRWLNARYQWGPNAWPIHWCEAVERKAFDCGVFAAISREIFLSKNVRAFSGQIILRAGEQGVEHFEKRWEHQAQAFQWTGRGFLYHEVVIVEPEPGRAKVYDPTEGVWLKPESTNAFESAIAIRSEAETALNWGKFSLYPDQWCELEEDH